MNRYFDLYLTAGHSVPVVINANQYDSSETWIFTLYTEDDQLYTPASGSIVGLKSDGHTIANAGTVNNDGQVVIQETVQITAAKGINVFELVLDGNHGTANFVVLVEPRPGDNVTPSDSELTLMEQAIAAAGSIEAVSALQDTVNSVASRMDEFISSHAGLANETILWEGTLGGTGSVTLSEDASTFDTIAVYTQAQSNFVADTASEAHYFKASDLIANNAIVTVAVANTFTQSSPATAVISAEVGISGTQNKTFDLIAWKNVRWSGDATDDAEIAISVSGAVLITKVVGIKNEQADTEVLDARVGADGTIYSNLEQRLNAENTALKSAIEQGSGLTSAIKSALLQIAQKVAYIDEDGQTYYDDLYDALYPPIVVTAITLSANSLSFGTLNSTQQLTATTTPTGGAVTWTSSNTSVATVSQTGVVTSVGYGNATITATSGNVSATCSVSIAQATVTSISAVYTQSGTVYDTDSLDSLKSDLVVTATWSNQTTSTVASADYTLSGTLTVGTSTITVSYSGKSTTFTVNVSSDVDEPIVITDRTYVSGYIKDDGSIGALANNYVGNMYIPITGHIIIDFTADRNSVNTCRLAEYDSNQGFIRRVYSTVNNIGGACSFELDPNTAYVRVGFATSSPASVFEHFEVMKNTGVSTYLYYERGAIDSYGRDSESTNRVRSGYISLTEGTSAFNILYSDVANVTAQLKLYDGNKTFSSSAPSSPANKNENASTTAVYARLIFGISSGTLGNVDNSVIEIDGTIYRLKEGTIS